MYVLRLRIENEHAAVRGAYAEIHAVPEKEIGQDFVPDLSEIAGDDRGIVRRGASGVGKVCAERFICCRSHCRAHVVRVCHARVADAPGRDVRHIRAFALAREQQRARAGHGPLRRRRALPAVFKREPKLPLRRAEV